MFFKDDIRDVIETDICIVGSGAAGISLGLSLEGHSANVCIIEGGTLEAAPKPDLLYDFSSTGLPISTESRARAFGGTTTVWSGRWKRHDPIDFTKRDWVSHSGWPIQYETLLPYYEQAETMFGIPSSDETEGKRVGIIKNEMIEPTVFRNQRKESLDWGKTKRDVFERSKNVSVYLGLRAAKIEKVKNKVVGVATETLSGKSVHIKAKVFILAAGGIENPRILLDSDVGNEHDQVGRYYMDHPKGKAGLIEAFEPIDFSEQIKLERQDEPLYVGYRLTDEAQVAKRTLNSHVLLEPQFDIAPIARIKRKPSARDSRP